MKITSVFKATALSIVFSTCIERTQSLSQMLICQNKDCMKKCPSSVEGGLMQMMVDLIPPEDADKITIESSGCLSHCGSGPNLSVKNGNQERVFNGVNDVQTASAILDVGGDIDSPIALMLAVDMMAHASKSKYILICIYF